MEVQGMKLDSHLQITINKEFKKTVQRIALENDETLCDVVRRCLESYVNQNSQQLDTPKKLAKKKSI